MNPTFLQNYWYAAALSAEIADKPFGRTICGEPVVLYRTEAGAPRRNALPVGPAWTRWPPASSRKGENRNRLLLTENLL